MPTVLHPRHMSASELQRDFPDALALAWIGECSCGATVVRRWRDCKRNWDDSPHECQEAPPLDPVKRISHAVPVTPPKTGAIM